MEDVIKDELKYEMNKEQLQNLHYLRVADLMGDRREVERLLSEEMMLALLRSKQYHVLEDYGLVYMNEMIFMNINLNITKEYLKGTVVRERVAKRFLIEYYLEQHGKGNYYHTGMVEKECTVYPKITVNDRESYKDFLKHYITKIEGYRLDNYNKGNRNKSNYYTNKIGVIIKGLKGSKFDLRDTEKLTLYLPKRIIDSEIITGKDRIEIVNHIIEEIEKSESSIKDERKREIYHSYILEEELRNTEEYIKL